MRDFYQDVLPSAGNYALFLGKRKQHIWCEDLDELTRQTEAHAQTTDLYFAVASFETTSGRTADNALYSRAFYFDIDAGPEKYAKHGDKVYPTQADARRALVDWCKQTSLYPRHVVSSGAGLHVYFSLDADATPAEWKPVADGLKAMALSMGLRIDAAVTGDIARILRPVGTLHHSGKPVTGLMRTGKDYSLAFVADLVKDFVTAPRKRVSRINDDVLMAPVGPPKTLAKVQERCPAMAAAMAARGDVAEPYWRAMLGIIKHTVEGEKAAHLYSQGHPSYDEADTQAKFDRWAAGPSTCLTFEAENASACAGCKYKGTIKSPIVLGAMTPDLVAALPAPEPEPQSEAPAQADEPAPFASDEDEDKPVVLPWSKYLPENFRVVAKGNGHIMAYKHMVPILNEAGDKVEVQIETPFCAVPFWFESWAAGSSEADQAMAVFCAWDEHRKTVTRYTFPTRMAAKRDSMFAALASQNIQVYPETNHSKTAMSDFVKASLEMMRVAGQRQKILERFGTMYDQAGNVVVAQGAHLIDHTGKISEGVVHDALRGRGAAYRVPVPHKAAGQWGPEVWPDIQVKAQRHINYLREFYDTPNFSPYQLAIMLAWASPMLAFMQGSYRPGNNLPGIGLTVSLYSPRSGIGKTAAMHAAALAFGSPSDLCLQLDRNGSTANARQAIVVQSGTMPVFLDEMEDLPAAELASLVSSVGNGMPKSRMNKDLSLRGGTTFAVVNLMSTNKSHRELVAAARDESPAVQMRMLEIECSGVRPVTPQRASEETEARASLHDCAGAVGAMLHRRMASLGAESLNQLGMECAAKAREMLQGEQDGRFMWRALGAMLAVRRLLKYDGLSVFALDTLAAEFKKWHDAGYEFAADNLIPQDGPSIMAAFLSDIAGNTLITLTETQRHGGDETRTDIPLNDRIPNPILARAVLHGRYLYCRTVSLREWCGEKKLGFNSTIAKCRDSGVIALASNESARKFAFNIDLCKGTKLSTGVRDSVMKVWLDKLPAEVVQAPMNAENVVEIRKAELRREKDTQLAKEAT